MAKIKWKRQKMVKILCLMCSIIFGINQNAMSAMADNWPKFGLVYQTVKDYKTGSKRYIFYWGSQKVASLFYAENKRGIYLPNYNLIRICPVFSRIKAGPDYEFIIKYHPEWLLKSNDGSFIIMGKDEPAGFAGFRLDLGNPQYNEYAIAWIKQQAFSGQHIVKDIGLDNGMFFYGIPNSKYGGADGTQLYRAAWEYFLRRLSESLRPQHKIVLNVGSSDLPTFARMIRHVDGVLQEDLCHPLHKSGFNPEKAQQAIRDKWEKGQWCMENGKIWAVRYNSTINGLKLSTTPKTTDAYISVGEREIIVSNSKQEIFGKVNLDSPEANTLSKAAQALEETGLRVEILNPYGETASAGALQPVKYAKIGDGLILKLKQAPREAFLFGYCAVLMVAGPNSYFIIGDERHQEYYYPEMDWPVGSPLGPKKEIAPQVYHRAFAELDAYLNLSESPFLLPDGHTLLPFRGGLIKKVVTVQSPL